MQRIVARLVGGDEIGLPESEKIRPEKGCPSALKKKTAESTAARHGGREMSHAASAELGSRPCRGALGLASVDLVACFSDEGYFVGREVAR